MPQIQTSQFQEVAITRAALLVLDPRDWFASWHGTGIDLVSISPGPRVPAVIRPTVPITVTAEPLAPGDPGWPFGGVVELMLIQTPSGLLAFYGRVQATGGLVLRVPRRATTCVLRIAASGFAPAVLKPVTIAGPDGPPSVQTFNLYPAPGYPFPTGQQPNGNAAATLLSGDVVNPDGSGIAGVEVSVADQPNLVSTFTSDIGGWILVLDQQTDLQTVASPVSIVFGSPVNLTATGVAFTAGATTRLPRTSLRGVVRLANGVAVSGAAIAVAGFPGSSTSRPDGTWVFCLGVNQPLSGTQAVTIGVAAPGHPPATQAFTLTFGTSNSVPVITV